jgi:5'-nucleotidase (lipoprotein e(P4) family)
MKKIFIICLVVVSSCVVIKTNNEIITTSPSNSIVINGKLYTALYQQKSAEYKSLCFQAYNFAAIRLDQYQSKTNLPKAIITDIDETVLDNSPYAVHQALLGKEYEPQSWYEWSIQSNADSVPGAPNFLKYAASKGVEIFYITNRLENERQSTLVNLKKFGLPNADDNHLLLKSSTSGKEPRRQQVAATHEIVMLLGDNLADFSSLFDKKNPIDRFNNTVSSVIEFGNRFIIIPNPGYGDWESTLWDYNYKMTSAQKDSVYKSFLKSY